jgi:hypothetical protein
LMQIPVIPIPDLWGIFISKSVKCNNSLNNILGASLQAIPFPDLLVHITFTWISYQEYASCLLKMKLHKLTGKRDVMYQWLTAGHYQEDSIPLISSIGNKMQK